MCIICVKPEGKKIDKETLELLENCWEYNPDGAGLMFPVEDKIFISKGFMEWEELEDYISNNPEFESVPVVFHFRWSTHGSISQHNCHPFPVTKDMDDLMAVETYCDMGVVHNGVISQMPKDKVYSDTFLFTRDYLANLGDAVFDKGMRKMITGLTGSKFVFMTPNKLEIMGSFVHDYGMYFSNDTYKAPVVTRASTYGLVSGVKSYKPLPALKDACSYGLDSESEDDDQRYHYSWHGDELENLYKDNQICDLCGDLLGGWEQEICDTCLAQWGDAMITEEEAEKAVAEITAPALNINKNLGAEKNESVSAPGAL